MGKINSGEALTIQCCLHSIKFMKQEYESRERMLNSEEYLNNEDYQRNCSETMKDILKAINHDIDCANEIYKKYKLPKIDRFKSA